LRIEIYKNNKETSENMEKMKQNCKA